MERSIRSLCGKDVACGRRSRAEMDGAAALDQPGGRIARVADLDIRPIGDLDIIDDLRSKRHYHLDRPRELPGSGGAMDPQLLGPYSDDHALAFAQPGAVRAQTAAGNVDL